MLTATIVSVADCFMVLPRVNCRQDSDLFLCLCKTSFSDGIGKILQDQTFEDKILRCEKSLTGILRAFFDVFEPKISNYYSLIFNVLQNIFYDFAKLFTNKNV